MNMIMGRLLDVSLAPDASKLPGGGTLMDLTNGLAAWALIFAVGVMVLGAGAWALGSVRNEEEDR
jgi:hypothetical protein